jgi:hypothetical protein
MAPLGNEVVTLLAPEPQAVVPFEVTFPQRAAFYRYEILP